MKGLSTRSHASCHAPVTESSLVVEAKSSLVAEAKSSLVVEVARSISRNPCMHSVQNVLHP